MKGKRLLFLLATAVLLLSAGAVLSQSSASFNLNWSTIAGGTGYSWSADYRVEGTIGQPVAHTDPAASTDYRAASGFWPPFAGIESPDPPPYKLHLPYVSR
jgi:hypothetical protein